MEGPACRLCLTSCYIKRCKPLGTAGNPPELGQPPLSRSCSCSRRTVKQEWSNSASKGALPIIPEYPGFQDVKLSRSYLGNPAFNQIFQDLERGKNCSPQVSNFPRRGSLPHCLGHSGGCLKGHQSCSPGFRDKPLQEYFKERLQELGSSQRSSRRAKGVAERSQSPFLAARGARRSSCSSVLLVAHGQEGQQPCSPAHQLSRRGSQCQAQRDIQNVLKLCTGDFLDLLTMHIAAPLEVFVQKK